VESGATVVVGVNRFQEQQTSQSAVFRMDQPIEQRQIERVRELRASRDAAACSAHLGELEKAARSTDNLMPPILAACAAKATVGEISDVLRNVFGEYKDS
jgi:methylmalonyl-CoA mutase N-terminal domain/subunit